VFRPWKEFVLKRAILIGLAALLVGMLALPASADSLTEGFESFATGTPLVADNDWTYTGAGLYDVGIEQNGINGTKSVRISNGLMSGSFGDWLFSKPLNAAARETANQEFVAEFDLESMSDSEQPGLQISVAPQTGGGARMSFLKFADTPAGIVVTFADVLNLPEDQAPGSESWREVQIGQPLNRTEPHHVKLVMNLVDGPHNDVVQVYIDGSAGLVPGRIGEATFDGFYAPVDNQPTINKAKAGQTIPMKWRLSATSFATSWEDYYRYNGESNAGIDPEDWTTRQVDSLIFQARCVGAPGTPQCANANDPDGFLIDNVSYTSSSIGTPLPVTTQGVSDPSVYGNPPFTASGEDCGDLDGNIDPIETVAAPGSSGLTYNEATGIWHYNWQTPKSYAKHCVRLTLNLTGDSTLFKFTK
jgi:hypothetical protein